MALLLFLGPNALHYHDNGTLINWFHGPYEITITLVTLSPWFQCYKVLRHSCSFSSMTPPPLHDGGTLLFFGLIGLTYLRVEATHPSWHERALGPLALNLFSPLGTQVIWGP